MEITIKLTREDVAALTNGGTLSVQGAEVAPAAKRGRKPKSELAPKEPVIEDTDDEDDDEVAPTPVKASKGKKAPEPEPEDDEDDEDEAPSKVSGATTASDLDDDEDDEDLFEDEDEEDEPAEFVKDDADAKAKLIKALSAHKKANTLQSTMDILKKFCPKGKISSDNVKIADLPKLLKALKV